MFINFEILSRQQPVAAGGSPGPGPPGLASFKVSYVSPENHKIGKSGWWRMGEKNGVWRRKTGFENFSLNEN